MTDEDIWRLNRGGHDPHKVYAAYHAAVNTVGRPTVILAKTVKGFGMGKIGEGKNTTHQQKKLTDEAVREFRDRFSLPIPDDQLHDVPFIRPNPRQRRDQVPAGAPRRARRLPAAATGESRRVVHDAGAVGVRGRDQRDGRRSRDVDDDGLRAHSHRVAARQATRTARRADHPRRGAHLRHGRDVPAARHLQPAGPAVRAGRSRPGVVLQGRQGGDRSSRKASTRRAR